MTLNMQYFETLRGKINQRLNELVNEKKYDKSLAKSQIEEFPWLYGALGKVPSDVMFICENPSITGVKKAHVDTIDGGRPDIEAQWWGGSKDRAAKCFRKALYKLKLKTTQPRERGGWECYITNVIKQSNVPKDQEHLPPATKRQQARDWADILQWEIDAVKPKYVFCVGDNAFNFIRMLQKDNCISQFPFYKVMHYSAHGKSDEEITTTIISGVRAVMKK